MNRNFVYIIALIMIASALFGMTTAEITDNNRERTRANDDDPWNATTVQFDDVKVDDMDSDTDDSDWFKITLTKPDVLILNLTVPANADFDIYLLNDTFEAVGFSEEVLYGGYEQIIYTVPIDGLYYILCSAWDGNGQYTLKIIDGTPPDNDNDPGNATSISVGGSKSETLSRGNYDFDDWYVISLTSGQRLEFDLDVPSSGDFDVWLYDAPPSWHAASSAKYGLGVDEKFGFEPENSGTYYIKINAWEGQGQYVISVSSYQNDNNDEPNNAVELSLPLTNEIDGQLISGLDDMDYYQVSLRENDFVYPILEYDSSNEFNLYINDSVNDELNMSNSTSGHEEINFTCQEEGIYYILVERQYGSGDYTLDVDFIVGNLPPQISSYIPLADDVDLNEGEDLRFEVSIEDEDLASLTYEWSVDNVKETGATENFFDVNTSYIAEFSAGLYEITVDITDSGDLTVSRTWNLTVIDVNQLPEIEIKEPMDREITINETDSIYFEIEVSDIDGPTPGIQWSLDGEELDDEDDDNYEFATDYLTAGVHTISVNVTDSVNESLINSTSWTVTVLNKDRHPELANMTPSRKARTDELTSLEFSIDASDPDGDTVSYEWYLDGKKIKDADENSYTYVPDSDSADGITHEIMVMVWAENLESNHTWKLDIENVNRRPKIDILGILPAPDEEFTEGDEVEFFIYATDPDGDDITYTFKILETKKSERELQEDFMNVYHKLNAGTYTINITAEDDDGAIDYYEFVIEVKERPVTDTAETPGFGIGILLLALICLIGFYKAFSRN
ncbi:MAG: hypothetical protein QF682_11060 [Candidatus Thermoplasmatota archaeon]|jgi:hypothetical protein|nr:hypothetical protein [Candidatus Thermoplasmatota archaeon]